MKRVQDLWTCLERISKKDCGAEEGADKPSFDVVLTNPIGLGMMALMSNL